MTCRRLMAGWAGAAVILVAWMCPAAPEARVTRAAVLDKLATVRVRKPLDGWAIRILEKRPLAVAQEWPESETALVAAFLVTEQDAGTDTAPYVNALRAGAAAGDEDSQLTLAGLYWVAEDYVPAVAWFGKAAGQGALEAQYVLGFAHLWGMGGTTNRADGIQWFVKAAEQEMPEAQLALAQVYLEGMGAERDPAQGQLWLKRAARGGHMKALEMLGMYYRLGMFVPQSDALAERCLLKAVARGSQSACAELGLLYAEGSRGADAVRWLVKGANSGRADVCYELGRLYFNGVGGIPRDHFKAFHWWRTGAERGHPGCQNGLAHLYAEGKGVEQDKVLAEKWRSAARGE